MPPTSEYEQQAQYFLANIYPSGNGIAADARLSYRIYLIQPFIDGFLTAIALFFANCTNYNAYAPNVAKMRYAAPRMRSRICRMIDL